MDSARRPAVAESTPGILTLAHILRRHWRAVHRDLLHTPRMAWGCRQRDIFSKFTVSEMVAIVVAAPPGSAVYHALTGGYGTSEELLATWLEKQSGLIGPLAQRIPRQGVTDLRPNKMPDIRDPKTRNIRFDSMTIEEFEAKRKAKELNSGYS